MSFTRAAVLFQSRVRGPNSEVGTQIYGLADLPLHACRSSSSLVASAICPTSPRGARVQLTRHRKRTKTKRQQDRRTAETVGVVLNFFSFHLSLGRPRGDWNLRPDRPAYGTR
ncbi:hypothetical protein L3X38_011903 [Prunus dulcis]|uniref:Uncharacterized protein n=1 Tax=Prunus dulcis TaxID=3755 RepID=A0AAD4WKQ9_PRUDU|nr:hypothetical protein L3X38_011903 [Prunus dulcis]